MDCAKFHISLEFLIFVIIILLDFCNVNKYFSGVSKLNMFKVMDHSIGCPEKNSNQVLNSTKRNIYVYNSL